jgi:nucleotide-binding universal stress UspA family protein
MSWLKKSCVVVPVDFSEHSFKAMDVAKEFVEETSNLHLIHVTRPWDEHNIGGSWGQETEAERLQSIENALQDRLEGTDCPDAHVAVHIGSPAVEISRYAEEAGAELIVMPSHGRTGIKHFALGSVAERVLRRAPCPVLVLREEKEKKGKEKKIISYD